MKMILAGDIGGTKTNLALFEKATGAELREVEQDSFPSREYDGLEAVIVEFLKGRQLPLEAACFGVAGPVINGVSKTTQLPWVVSEESLSRVLHLDNVRLLNDLEATAYGVLVLKSDAFVTLNQGEPKGQGNIAVIAVGTGMGASALVWDGARYHATASEAGHADFAPRNEPEIEFLRYMLTIKHRISYERILSGAGLVNIYNFLKERGHAEEPVWLTSVMAASEDQAATISRLALAGETLICVKALDLFVAVYGAQAGNLALTFKATSGVYVGGGIAPKIIEKLKDGAFIKAFKDKGRLSPLVEATPVHVIMNQRTALVGAAEHAATRQMR
jgi:glucokinase